MWKLDSIEEAKTSRCGNCAAFDITTKTLDCIAKGIGDDEGTEDPFDVIEAGKLGYCRFLKFKCAAVLLQSKQWAWGRLPVQDS